ncbi:hypothetical protein VW35_04325 [Devosia soli]|uniref:SPOR domain-containing protein n=1 Tax=Devosia soli TaxID=361041 RepID=A0A0F5LDR9_9HYPH|nr:hypothetical protein [Devosia soli]KKB79742.1 hypothetical protein VW35_04325 [Devosia soli]
MAPKEEEFRQTDVTAWGIAALVCAGVAVVAANVSSLIPSSVLTALHVPRNDTVSMAQLRQQVMELRTETAQLRRQNEILTTRFSLQEQTGNEVIRRVRALEVSMPNVQELRPTAANIDRSVTTASIGQKFDADGGTVVVRHSPMPENITQPLPAAIEPTVVSASGAEVGYGVAIGPGFGAGKGKAQWRDLEVRLGSMLMDMDPLLADDANAGNQRLVLGPLQQMAEARDFCQRLEQMEIACTPTVYSGTPLTP